MAKDPKIWLVRTRTNDILGPFSQRELFAELHRQTFNAADEIAPSLGMQWLPAQVLLNRDSDDFTQTSTRNTRNTQVTRNTSITSKIQIEGGQTTSPEHFIPPNEDLTPTPEYVVRPSIDPPMKRSGAARQRPPHPGYRIGPLITGMVAVTALWMLVNHLKPDAPPTTEASGDPILSAQQIKEQGESPFVREIYNMIRSGQSSTALKRLHLFHERQATKTDLEYLIPYAALLITEGDSPSRARKLLDRIILGSIDPRLKAQAHHWLGYLMLQQQERDMGESHFLEALQLDRQNTASRFNLGRVYLRQERHRLALDYFQQAEVQEPNLWLIHIYKARAKAALGLLSEAAREYQRAVDYSPDRWLVYFYKGLFLLNRGQTREAQRLMGVMLTRDPNYEVNSPPPLGYYQEKVNYAEYLEGFIKIMEGGSGEERELGKLYISYLLSGPNSPEAKRIEAVADKGGLTAKVLALKVALDQESTKSHIRKAVQRLPRHLPDFGYYAYVLRGEAAMRLGELEAAKNDFQKAIASEQNNAIAHWGYATVLRKLSREQDARKQIRKLLTYHPNYIPAIVAARQF